MNIQNEEKALSKLSPQKYTIRILVIAVAAISSGLATLFGILNGSKDQTISSLRSANKEQNVEIIKLTTKLIICDQNAAREKTENLQEQVRYEREKSRQKDSIAIALLTAQQALKKAIKDEK